MPNSLPPKERQVQRSILEMMGIAFPHVFVAHVPNGAHLSGDERARCMQIGALKGDGLKNGFPDLVCYWNRGHCLMEVKRPGYRPSDVRPDQLRIHETLTEMGWAPAIVTSPEEAFAFLRERGAPTHQREWRRAA
jgi:hypothetical protein